MNLQIRIWISNVVLFVVPILIAIILFLLYFTGLRILANAGYYLRIEQEQQFKSVSRITETITFYGLENNLIDSLVKPSYSLLDPKEVYVEVLDQGNMVYSYGNPQIYSASAIVGLIDVASGKKDMEISAFLMNERSRMQKEEQKVAGETENERCPVKRRKKFQL